MDIKLFQTIAFSAVVGAVKYTWLVDKPDGSPIHKVETAHSKITAKELFLDLKPGTEGLIRVFATDDQGGAGDTSDVLKFVLVDTIAAPVFVEIN